MEARSHLFMYRVILVLCACLILVGCNKQATYMGVPVPGNPDNYSEYHDGVLGEEDVLLVVTYADCALCMLSDAAVISLYNEHKIDLKAYKINIDTDADTATRLGITKKDFFVKVNAAGQVSDRLTTADGAKLRAMLGLSQ